MTIYITPVVFTLDKMKEDINELLLKYKRDISGFWGLLRHGPEGYTRALQLKKLVMGNSSSPECFFKQLYEFHAAQTAFSSTLTDDLQLTLEKFVGVNRPANRELMALTGALMTGNRFMRAEGEARIQNANSFMQQFQQKVQEVFQIVDTQTHKEAQQLS